MRQYNYMTKITQNTLQLEVYVKDRFGKQKFMLTGLKGWRKEIAQNYINILQSPKLDDRTYLIIETLKITKNFEEAIKYMEIIKSLGSGDMYFWSSKFLTIPERARKAWKAFYGR